MNKADLHVHSLYSAQAANQFVYEQMGIKKSYTNPEFIYKAAKNRGMSFVTITDHNSIEASLILKEKYPGDVFTGLESTVYFPEDNKKIHLLIYGINGSQFREIELLRTNIYDLRDYIKENSIACSVAHPTSPVNSGVPVSYFEKLILLFDVFEGINGSLNRTNNETWPGIISGLTEDTTYDLYRKYKIEPFSDTPWLKGITGGSNDTTGIYIGSAFTLANGDTPRDFLESITKKTSGGSGAHSDYKRFAYSICMHGHEFLERSFPHHGRSFMGRILNLVFKNGNIGLSGGIKFYFLKLLKKNKMARLLDHFIGGFLKQGRLLMQKKIDMVHQSTSNLLDEYFKILLKTAEQDYKSWFKEVSSLFPVLFLAVPFLASLKHLRQNNLVLQDLKSKYASNRGRKKRILWFTDTLNDLDGISVTLRKIASLAREKERDLKIASCTSPGEVGEKVRDNLLSLPHVGSITMPSGYDVYKLRIPSLLRSLEEIYKFEPDEIIISTPGPAGLLGILAAKLLSIKCVGIYHTDFTLQAKWIIGDEPMLNLIENYIYWAWSNVDELRVSTREYINILEKRRYNVNKMKLFKRGIDTGIFKPKPGGRDYLKNLLNLADGFNLLYVGRVTKDKRIDFLLDIYTNLTLWRDDVNLIIIGDGTYRKELEVKIKNYDRIYYPGKLANNVLPDVYSGADLFVFPSDTDTFGMVILESQACGLPAMVSHIGGPREIIKEGKTGYIINAYNINAWVSTIFEFIKMKKSDPEEYENFKKQARYNVLSRYDWHRVFDDLIEDESCKADDNPVRAYEQKTIVI